MTGGFGRLAALFGLVFWLLSFSSIAEACIGPSCPVPAPGVPSNVTVPSSSSTGDYTLSWSAATNMKIGSTYEVEVSLNSGSYQFVGLVPKSTTSYTFTDQPSGTYRYRVRGCNMSQSQGQVCGNYGSSNSLTVSIVLPTPSTPAAPITPSTSTGSANITWSQPTGTVTHYDLQKRLNSGSWTTAKANGTNTSETIYNLTDGSWTFRVRACNQEFCSAYSASSGTTVRVKPGNPGIVTGNAATSTSGSVTLNWTAASGTVTRYDVFYRKDNSGSYDLLASKVSGFTYIASLNDGVYDFRIRACNEFTWSCRWNAIGSNTEVRKVPNAPTLVAPASSSEQELSVSWNSPNNATYFALESRIDDGSWTTLSGNTSANSIVVSTPATARYQFRAKACNTQSWSCSGYGEVAETQVAINLGDQIPDAQIEAIHVPQQENVGLIQGEAGNSGGAATYSVPIAVAPGRNGMKPSISLNYSSRSGNGLLGQGWSLSAGGSISRCASIYDIDGYSRSVQLNSNDRLCLNGERLKLFDGTDYWLSGATYHPESNPKITVVKVSSNTFEVRYPNGAVDFYGEGKDIARNNVTTSWMLSRKHDSSENAIHYSYDNLGDDAQLYLTRIDYTGFQNTAGNRHVDFAYQTRQDVRVSYMAGTRATQTKRLKSITTLYDNQNISQYSFNYRDDSGAYFQKLNLETSEWSGSAATSGAQNTPQTAKRRSLLSDIELCAWDQNNTKSCLQKTVINRSLWKAGFKAQQQVMTLPDDISFMGKVLTGDFDGDAKVDYGFTKGSYLTSQWGMNVFLSSTQQWQDISHLVNQVSSGKHSVKSLTLDYDLDGQTDFASAIKNANEEFELALVRYNGSTFDAYGTGINVDCGYEWSMPEGHIRSFCQSFTLDYNGDGKTDILALQRQANRQLTLRLYKNTHTGYSDSASNHQPSFELVNEFALADNYTPIRNPLESMDLDGDGRIEFVGVRNLDDNTNSNKEAISLKVSEQGVMSLEILGEKPLATTAEVHPLFHKKVAADFNGDGLVDIYTYDNRDYSYKMYINTGNGFSEVTSNLPELPPNVKAYDYNQDGLTDLLVTTDGGYDHSCGEQPSDQNQEFIDTWWQCTQINSQPKWHVLQTSLATDGSINFTAIVESEFNIYASHEYLTIVDHNGDGSLDLLAQKGGSQMTGPEERGFYLYENPNSNTDAVTSITAGVGKFDLTTQFEYRSLSDLAGLNRYSYSKEQNYPYVKFNTATQMLDKMSNDDGQGGTITSKFVYKDARYHVAGRGFQGFRVLEQENTNAGTKSIAEFNQTFPFTGKVIKSESWVRDDFGTYQQVSEKVVDWQSLNIRNAFLIYPATSTERKFNFNDSTDVLSSSTASVESIDEEGYVTKSTTLADSGFGKAETITHTSYDHSKWPGKVSSVTVDVMPITDRPAGVAIDPSTDFKRTVRTSYLEWDEAKRLPTKVKKEFFDKNEVLDPQATEVSTQYNQYGLPLEVATKDTVSGDVRKVTTTYSKDGQVSALDGYFPFVVENDKAQTITTYTNPKYGKPSKAVDSNGQWVESFYDAFARVKKTQSGGLEGQLVSQPSYMRYLWCDRCDGMSSDIVYKVNTYQAGLPVATEYKDKLNRTLVSHTSNPDGEDIYSRTDYDALGRVTFESIVSGNLYESRGTSYDQYDNLGRLKVKTVAQSDNQELVITYDYLGHKTDINAGGNTMSRTYNGFGQLMQSTDADNGVTQYAYDGAGNPIVMKDAKGNTITALHNAIGQKEWVNDPNMGLKTFTYTGFGEIYSDTDANNVTTYFEYDVLGRMTHRYVGIPPTGLNQSQAEAVIQYDGQCQGLPMRETLNRTGETYDRSYEYDEFCRAFLVKTHIDGVDYEMEYHFDNNYGRLKGKTFPGGLTVAYEYQQGVVKTVKNIQSGKVYRSIQNWDAQGNWISAQIGNSQMQIDRSFWAETGQMQGSDLFKGSTQLQSLSYEYDKFDNLYYFYVGNQLGSTFYTDEEHYQYDSLNRLTSTLRTFDSNQTATVNYSYDEVGNLLRKTDFSATEVGSISYGTEDRTENNAGPNAVTSVALANNGGTRSYHYDNNGNLIEDLLNGSALRTIEYNAFNKPTLISVSGGRKLGPYDGLNTQSLAINLYYGPNQMRYKQYNSLKGETTIYIDKEYEVVKGGGKEVRRSYIDDVAIHVETREGSSIDVKELMFHKDRLGSNVALVDMAGNVAERRTFDAFGKPRTERLYDTQTSSLVLLDILDSDISNRGFTDHEHFDDTQLIHMNGRAYDYNLGRFLSVDPFIQEPGNSQSMNPYSYILNNPLAGTDPSGYRRQSYAQKRGITFEIMTGGWHPGADQDAYELAKYQGCVASGGSNCAGYSTSGAEEEVQESELSNRDKAEIKADIKSNVTNNDTKSSNSKTTDDMKKEQNASEKWSLHRKLAGKPGEEVDGWTWNVYEMAWTEKDITEIRNSTYERELHISFETLAGGNVSFPNMPKEIEGDVNKILKTTSDALEVIGKVFHVTYKVDVTPVTYVTSDVTRTIEVIRHRDGREYSYGWSIDAVPVSSQSTELISNSRYTGIKRHDQLSTSSIEMSPSQYHFYRNLSGD